MSSSHLMFFFSSSSLTDTARTCCWLVTHSHTDHVFRRANEWTRQLNMFPARLAVEVAGEGWKDDYMYRASGLFDDNIFFSIELCVMSDRLHQLFNGTIFSLFVFCSTKPSARLFEMFNNLYMLAEGKCIYQGSVLEV